jgi:cholesterol transport system auxiliary component
MKTFFENLMKPISFGSRFVFLPTLLVGAVALNGCLARPPLNPQTFSFNPATPVMTQVTSDQPVLGLKKLAVASPFDERSLVYRTGEFTYARDPYARFLDAPGEELRAPVRIGLAGEGDFSAVLDAGSALKPDILAEINVRQLYGDFRQANNAQAVLTVHFIFFAATNGIAAQSIFQKEYSRHLPIKSATAAALMRGWNQALNEILAEALKDFRQAKKSKTES